MQFTKIIMLSSNFKLNSATTQYKSKFGALVCALNSVIGAFASCGSFILLIKRENQVIRVPQSRRGKSGVSTVALLQGCMLKDLISSRVFDLKRLANVKHIQDYRSTNQELQMWF